MLRQFLPAGRLARHFHSVSAPQVAATLPLSEAVVSPVKTTTSAAGHAEGCTCCSVHGAHKLAQRSLHRFHTSLPIPSASSPSTTPSSSSSTRHFSDDASSSSSISQALKPLMRAQVLTSVGPQFVMGMEQLRRPSPKRGEVLVKVRAAGLCHTDLHIMKGEVPFPVPAVMGHELSGEIVELGPGVSAHSSVKLRVGQRVASSFIMPCGECDFCVRGQEDLCSTFFAYNRGKGQLYDGTTRLFRTDDTPIAMYSFAAMAEYAVVPATAVYPLPKNADLIDSAIIGCAMFTAYGAVYNAARLRPEENVVIIGGGGIGSGIVQMSKTAQADKIIVVDIDDAKLALMQQLGATHVINATKENAVERVRELTHGKGAEVCFEALGKPQTFSTAFNCVADGGRAVMVGIAPVGMTAPIEITRLVRRKIQIIGSFGAKARVDMPAILRMIERGQIDLAGSISQRFSLKDATKGFQLLDQGKILGRAVVDMGL